MAHELEMNDEGEGSMFFVGNETPWHGLGRRLIQAPSVAEGLVAAGLDWTVGKKPLFTAENEKVDHFATFRESDGKILGVVGPRYQPLQNIEAFNFFNPFLEAGLAELHTAGSLKEGKKVWVLAKIAGSDMEIARDDVVEKYLLLSNSHDGSTSVRVGFSPVRVVCANTLAMAHNSADSQLIRISHSRSVVQNLEMIREMMRVANASFEATADQYRALAARKINSADLQKYVQVVFNIPETDEKATARKMAKIIPLFEKGRGNDLPGVRGTMWGAYNAVTEYLSYGRGRTQDSRLESLWFGDSAMVNDRALSEAARMAA